MLCICRGCGAKASCLSAAMLPEGWVISTGSTYCPFCAEAVTPDSATPRLAETATLAIIDTITLDAALKASLVTMVEFTLSTVRQAIMAHIDKSFESAAPPVARLVKDTLAHANWLVVFHHIETLRLSAKPPAPIPPLGGDPFEL